MSSIFTYLCLNFKNCIYQSAEARPGPSEASKIILSARKFDVFKLTLLNIFAKGTIMEVEGTVEGADAVEVESDNQVPTSSQQHTIESCRTDTVFTKAEII